MPYNDPVPYQSLIYRLTAWFYITMVMGLLFCVTVPVIAIGAVLQHYGQDKWAARLYKGGSFAIYYLSNLSGFKAVDHPLDGYDPPEV